MEEQTLRFYLRVFSLSIVIILVLTSFYIFNLFNKNLNLNKKLLIIEKGEKIEEVLTKNILNLTKIDIFFIKIYVQINKRFLNKFIHFGNFYLDTKISLNELLKTISKPSNVLNKITIIEGWSKKQLNLELSKYFFDLKNIPYENIIADTYYFEFKSENKSFLKKLINTRDQYFDKYKENEIFEKFNSNEIMIIGSLIEKEGLDEVDKSKIASVIFNRIDNNMKLQIDATVLYSLTNGNYDLGRKLLISDLKVNHTFNTYINYGLPPKPIAYVGKKTLDIIFENKKTDFLFYFFNNSLNKHIFSKTYKEHKNKLNEYRNKK